MDVKQFYQMNVKRERFEDIIALEKYRWNLKERYDALINEKNTIYEYMRDHCPFIYDDRYLLGTYKGDTHLFSYNDSSGGISHNIINAPTPSYNSSEKDILITKAVDLPLYINIKLDKRVQDILDWRLKEDITDIPTNDQVITDYFIRKVRKQRIVDNFHAITNILLEYIQCTYHNMTYKKENQYNEYVFRMILNDRTYLVQYKNRDFSWLSLPEQAIIEVTPPNDISPTFFEHPKNSGWYNPSPWKDI